MKPAGITRTAREVFLTLGAVLGVVCIVVTAAGFAFDIKPLVFRSGSMSPAIHTGDLSIARTVDADTLKRGDIVSVVNAGGSRVTHRLVNSARLGDARQLTLKGDANDQPDSEVYTVSRAERVWFTIPKAGYVVNAATSPAGVFVLGLYVAVLLVTGFRRGSPSDPDDPAAPSGGRRRAPRAKRRRPSRAASRTASRSVAAGIVGGTLLIAGPAIAAPWTDAVPVSGGTYTSATASTIPAPVVSCGTLTVGTTRLNWTAMPGATGYVLHYGSGGATSETVGSGVTSKTFTGLATSGTFTVQAQYGTAPWTSPASNAKSYTVLLVLVGVCT